MKLIVLSDNRKFDKSMQSEHGLCIYLETDNYTCLLDTGASDNYIRNAEKLGVDIKTVNFVFISHGHADHVGGLPAFLEMNKTAKIVISKNALNQKYFSKRNGFHSISLDFDFSPFADRFVFVDSEMVFRNEIWVFSVKTNRYASPKGNANLYKDVESVMELDDFNHELVITFGSERLFVFTGCTHKGLLNILDSVSSFSSKKIGTVLGGFHLLDSKIDQPFETDEEIGEVAIELKEKYPQTNFITGHCTGDNAFQQLEKVLGKQLTLFYTGYSINIE